MKKNFTLFVATCLFAVISCVLTGCNARSRYGIYNEIVTMPLADGHSARVNFSHKGKDLNVNVYLRKNGQNFRGNYVGTTKYVKRDSHYTFSLKQWAVADNLTKKEEKIYKEVAPISMEVHYDKEQKAYHIRFSNSRCPALNMSKPAKVNINQETKKGGKSYGKFIDGIGDGINFCQDTVKKAFDWVFGNLSFTSHWCFLFYLGGVLLMAIGVKLFSPLVWLGVIMQYAYLQYMTPPFFMLWPSIVGWGWMIVSVIPVIILVSLNFTVCLGVIGSAFTSWTNFIILLIPAFISILSIFTIIDIAITDHIELIIFFAIGCLGGGSKFVGTFIDNRGNLWDVYVK